MWLSKAHLVKQPTLPDWWLYYIIDDFSDPNLMIWWFVSLNDGL